MCVHKLTCLRLVFQASDFLGRCEKAMFLRVVVGSDRYHWVLNCRWGRGHWVIFCAVQVGRRSRVQRFDRLLHRQVADAYQQDIVQVLIIRVVSCRVFGVSEVVIISQDM